MGICNKSFKPTKLIKMSVKNSISVRTQRLDKLILCRMDDSTTENNTTSLNRDTLLDAFDVLYNECNKDALKNHNANILDFTKKCKYLSYNFRLIVW